MLLATTFGGLPTSKAAATETAASARVAVPASPDARALVLDFGDALEELHDSLAYDADARDPARVSRACRAVLAQYPAVRDAVGDGGTQLLVAAESMVDACRQGVADTLDVGAFEIVDGDYYAFRELTFDFQD